MNLAKVLKLAEYVHATLIFALFIPLLYAVGQLYGATGTIALYLKCLLVALPVVVTEQAVRRVKSLALYGLVCMALTAGIAYITGAFVCFLHQRRYLEIHELCYCIGMVLETLFIAIKRLRDRLRAAVRKKDDGFLEDLEESFLNTPSLTLVWYFVAMYVFGICFYSKMLCDLAFFSAIVYLFLALGYKYFETTKEYFWLNKRTKGIPKRRLYSISAGMMLGFGMLLLIGILPSVLLAGQRRYSDIRTWFDDIEFIPYDFEYDAEIQGAADGGANWMELLNDGKPAPKPSKVVTIVCWVLVAVCIACFAYGIVQAVRQVFRDFKNGLDENGDKIEELEGKDNIFGEETLKLRSHGGSEAEKIRRRYKKMIRKHRKEKPAVFESPIEIEELAGLKDSEEMQALHKEYEAVRYGRE